MNCITDSKDGIIISVKIIPNAPRSKVDGMLGDHLKIRIQAPPVDGKANVMLLKFLAQQLDIPASRLTLISGQTGRIKRIAAAGIRSQTARSRLGI